MSNANITTTVEHEGKTYTGQIGTIKRTTLGLEDHGIMSAFLHIQWTGGGIGVGGYTLDQPKFDENDRFIARVGSDFGLDHIMRILDTVGVGKWEDLPGKQVIVLFEGRGGLGSTSCGIAGITNEKVLDFKDHAQGFHQEAAA